MVNRNEFGYRTDKHQPLLATSKYFYSRSLQSIVDASKVALDGNDRTKINDLLAPVEKSIEHFEYLPLARQQLEDSLGFKINFEELRSDANEIRAQYYGLERVKFILPTYEHRLRLLQQSK